MIFYFFSKFSSNTLSNPLLLGFSESEASDRYGMRYPNGLLVFLRTNYDPIVYWKGRGKRIGGLGLTLACLE